MKLFSALSLWGLILLTLCRAASGVDRCAFAELIPKDRRPLTPFEFLSAEKEVRANGVVLKRWDPELETSVYQTMVEPRPDGSLPLVDPQAKAVILFFHGSGTMKAGGRNFIHNMNSLRPMGVSSLAIDLPFHGENQAGARTKTTDEFMVWLHGFVQRVKAEAKDAKGKPIPVYLGGHSFGPMVAQEYAARYPQDVAGLLLLSPSTSHSPALRWTYENITTPGWKYLEGEPAIPNDAGGEWADRVERGVTWPRKPLPERVKVKLVVGERDEWWPGNRVLPAKLGKSNPYTMEDALAIYRKAYPEMDVTLLPETGHMIWEAKGRRGKSIFIEAVEDLTGLREPANAPSATELLSARQRLMLLFKNSAPFRQWLGARYPHSLRTEQGAENYLKQWAAEREKSVGPWLAQLAAEHPAFAEARRYTIAALRKEAADPKGKAFEKARPLVEEFEAYLAAPQDRPAILVKADPSSPPKLTIASKLLKPEFNDRTKTVANFGASFLKSHVEDALAGTPVTFEALPSVPGALLAKATLAGKVSTRVVFENEARLNEFVERAYAVAWERNGYLSPGNNWTVEVAGLTVTAAQSATEVVKLSVQPRR